MTVKANRKKTVVRRASPLKDKTSPIDFNTNRIDLSRENDFELSRGFRFVGSDAKGVPIKAVAPYKTEAETIAKLETAGITVKSVSPVNTLFSSLDFKKNSKASLNDMASLADQIAAQFQTGLTFDRIFRIIGKTHPKIKVRKALHKIADQIQSGKPVPEAVAGYVDEKGNTFFPLTFINAFILGEMLGAMPDPETGSESNDVYSIMLRFFAKSQRKAARMGKAIMSGLLPSGAILLASVIVFFIQVYFIVPQFAQIFEGLLAGQDTSLPFATQMMIDLSEFMYSPPGVILGLALLTGLISSIYYFWFHDKGRERRGRLENSLPLFKNFFLPYHGSIFFRNLCIMFAHPRGDERFTTVAKTTSNPDFRDLGFHCAELVIRGVSFNELFNAHLHLTGEAFAPVAETIEANPGKAQELLFTYAKYLEQEAEEKLAASIAVISQMVYFFAAGIVAFILIASYAPLIDLVGRLSK